MSFNTIYEETVLVFVYGSLKRGFENEDLLYTAKSLGKAKTVKKYPLVVKKNKHYPYLIKKEGVGNFVEGELYRIKKDELKTLDKFEGKEFSRDKIKIIKKTPNRKRFLEKATVRPEKELEVEVYYSQEEISFSKEDISSEWSLNKTYSKRIVRNKTYIKKI